MVKKIKKYLKFVVCCALIMSLVAPSYAALSASDGSAFVTKAEFDAALADFNSRLTTFEAGINSKIDSQVTSYLDRNGIWNGKTQSLLTTLISNVKPIKHPVTGTTSSVTFEDVLVNINLINQCDKSGMLIFDWAYRGYSGVANNKAQWGHVYYIKNDSSWGSDAGEMAFVDFLVNGNAASTYVLFTRVANNIMYKGETWTGLNTFIHGSQMVLPITPVKQVALFFVQKNDRVGFKFTNGGHAVNLAQNGSGADVDCDGLNFYYNKAMVY